MNNMLTQYPTFASQVTGDITHIRTRVAGRPLTFTAVRNELDNGRPIVAGISPSGYRAAGVSEHVALIVGYDENDLIVNDPFPFEVATFAGNPYTAAGAIQLRRGQYQVQYQRFVERLQWRETIYRIRCAGDGCATDSVDDPGPAVRYGRSCRTPAGQCGPFFNQPAQRVGSACWCGTPFGRVNGVVVQP